MLALEEDSQIVVQLDFFKSREESERESLVKQFLEVKRSTDLVRKGIFARHNEIKKLVQDLSERLEVIERHICKKEDMVM